MATSERPAKRTKLMSDDESSGSSDNETLQAVTNEGLQVNEEYARRFEHNKKREEIQRLEERYPDAPAQRSRFSRVNRTNDDGEATDSEEDESEDDDGELATEDVDGEIFATLQAIRQKDPKVYNPDIKFYAEFDADENGTATMKKEKPMYLQDYHRQNLLAGHAEGGADDKSLVPTYQEEQDAIKRELVGSMHATSNGNAPAGDEDSDGDDEFLVAKTKAKASERAIPKTKRITDSDVATAEQDPETYLSNFMAARAWVPEQDSAWKPLDSDASDDERRADEFEEAYNMRFEDPAKANEKLQSFARHVAKYSARRDEKTGRQRTRDREREQRELAKKGREEDRARLRKLKIEEAEEKIRKIKEAAGMQGHKVDVEEWKDVIEGDFDDDKWEAEMRRRFGDSYYAEDEAASDEQTNGNHKKRRMHKPKWDDDIDINDLVPEFETEGDKAKFTLSSDDEVEQAHGDAEPKSAEEDDSDPEQQPARTKPATKKQREQLKADKKRERRLERRQIEDLVDSNLPLSHPNLSLSKINKNPSVGFRYRDTSPVSFGLSSRDILFADDSQLNQYAGLKKMAAFRDDDKKRRDKKRYSKKQRLREWRKETFGKSEGSSAELDNGPVAKHIADTSGAGIDAQRKKRKRSKGKKGSADT